MGASNGGNINENRRRECHRHSGGDRHEFVAIGVHSWANIRSVLPSVILDSAVEAESTRPFDKLRAPSKVEGLTLAATRSGRLNCGI